MRNSMKTIGWILVIGGFAACAFLVFKSYEQSRMAQMLKEDAQKAQTKIKMDEKQAADKEQELRDLKAKMDAIQKEKAAENADKPPVVPDPRKAGEVLGKMTSAIVSGRLPEKDNKVESGKSLQSGVMSMFTGPQGKQMAAMAGQMAVDTQYGAFFEEMQLPKEQEQRVRGVLAVTLTSEIEETVKAIQEQYPKEKLAEVKKQHDEQVRVELAKVMDAAQMATYDRYKEELPSRMLQQSVKMQIEMAAPNLSPETKSRAVQVLVEELLPTGAGSQGMGIPEDLDTSKTIERQCAAFQRAKERLATELDKEQMAMLDTYMGQQLEMLGKAAKMFAAIAEGEATPATPATPDTPAPPAGQ